MTPSYAPFAADGSEFIIEGTGVAPHVDIENDPYLEYNGEDQQLNKAIQVILEKLKTEKRRFRLSLRSRIKRQRRNNIDYTVKVKECLAIMLGTFLFSFA